jgi:hypothetical protein
MNRFTCGALLCVALSCTTGILAQDIPQSQTSDAFSRKNTFTLFAEYSPTSSHMLLGSSRQRILADFGGAYTRRLVRFWGSDLDYQVELRPVLFESDPVETITNITYDGVPVTDVPSQPEAVTGVCQPGPVQFTFPGYPPGSPPTVETYTLACGRQWTFGQSFAPIGFKYSMRTNHPLQPFLIGTLGYMYTSRPVPVADAESFNFDFGAGVELFRSVKNKRSVAVEARYHHFSNNGTATDNPGTDNITYKLSYSFGR